MRTCFILKKGYESFYLIKVHFYLKENFIVEFILTRIHLQLYKYNIIYNINILLI